MIWMKNYGILKLFYNNNKINCCENIITENDLKEQMDLWIEKYKINL